MPSRSAARAKPGRGARALVTSLAIGVGLLAAWVLVANTILREAPPSRDVVAALLAARDAAPAPTLAMLRPPAVPDEPLAAGAAPPVPVVSAAPPPLPPTDTRTGPAAAPETAAPGTTAPPATIVLAAADVRDATGSLAPPSPAASPPMPFGAVNAPAESLAPDSLTSDEAAEAPLAGVVPLPRKRPPSVAIPLPRPRPEIDPAATAATGVTLTPVDIEKHQPM
ncbi:hypothetical protein [Rhodoplanes serenus]|uniref:hypothetical protein n=1 Tax=Rhodoplanes serenus TaxID=200615 RepID=UPI000DABFE43|nr:hypothetical protein [Rhodoplanes serenus]RAI34806.1 hypothetical protein CH340_07890 [Rhodoplanes serenus]